MKSWLSESWNTKPILRRMAGRLRRSTDSPQTSTLPWPSSKPFKWSTKVVLPLPLGPSKATHSPSSSRKFTPLSAGAPSP
jgi:hypothetical protein